MQEKIDNSNEIIRQFDELILQKCDKMMIEQLKDSIREQFASKELQDKFIEKINNSMID